MNFFGPEIHAVNCGSAKSGKILQIVSFACVGC